MGLVPACHSGAPQVMLGLNGKQTNKPVSLDEKAVIFGCCFCVVIL